LSYPAAPALDLRDHDDFGSIPSKIMNVIDSKSLERDAGGKPVSTFPRPALEKPKASRAHSHDGLGLERFPAGRKPFATPVLGLLYHNGTSLYRNDALMRDILYGLNGRRTNRARIGDAP
jgi:hypothetical protein